MFKQVGKHIKSNDITVQNRGMNRKFLYRTCLILLPILIIIFMPVLSRPDAKSPPADSETMRTLRLPKVQAPDTTPVDEKPTTVWHPPHLLKVWTTVHKGRTFRVTQLPNCEHMDAVIAYNPRGESLQQAKKRLGGAAALTGSFHHPQTFALADFVQEYGAVYAAPATGRYFLAMYTNGKFTISDDYSSIMRKSDVSALALGQRLVPLQHDGFSLAFMNRVTDRMAMGLNSNFVFIVQGKSDIWQLSQFMQHVLPVTIAVNSDGGHVVRGVAPVHVVFRWSGSSPDGTMTAELSKARARK